jgi:hypothetical protein
MSSQSWLDYESLRLKLLSYVMFLCRLLFNSLTITTSTHTNYFDQVVKERWCQGTVESDNYTERIQFVNSLSTLRSCCCPASGPNGFTPKKPAIIT